MTPAEKKAREAVVRARCVGCSFERDVWAMFDAPMCDRCLMPMIAVRARLTREEAKTARKGVRRGR